jgi:hypothetical protein
MCLAGRQAAITSKAALQPASDYTAGAVGIDDE